MGRRKSVPRDISRKIIKTHSLRTREINTHNWPLKKDTKNQYELLKLTILEESSTIKQVINDVFENSINTSHHYFAQLLYGKHKNLSTIL